MSDESWIPALVQFLNEQEHVEAILLDPKRRKITVATLGQVDEGLLQARLDEAMQAIEEHYREDFALPAGMRMHALPGQTLLEKGFPCTTSSKLRQWREMKWPDPREVEEEETGDSWQFLGALAVICGVLGLTGFLGKTIWAWPETVSTAFFVLAMVAGGWDAAIDSWAKVRKGVVDIHFLMLAVAVGASLIGAFEEGALLLFLFSFSGALEHFALYRTRREINALFKAAPKTALRREANGSEQIVPVEQVMPDDRLIIKPGDLFPVDGVVIQGKTAADESTLTGEAVPVEKQKGDQVFSGTLNLWGALEMVCVNPAGESSLQKVIRMIQQAQHLRAPSERFTDKFGSRYTWGILGVTTVMFFVWWLVLGVAPFQNMPQADGATAFSAFYRAMTLLVVASPCALVLSIPSAILASIAWGARHGILFRGGAAIEKLAGVDTVALDKTGTLTTGELSVLNVESFPPGREREIAEMAFSLERSANHPIARAIVKYGLESGLQERPVDDFKSITGSGVQATFEGSPCILGRRELLETGPFAAWVDKLPAPDPEYSEVWVLHKDVIGRLLLRDQIRLESKAVMEALKARSIHTLMLTGDRRETAEAVAREIGIEEVRSGLKPEEKLAAVRQITVAGGKVAMVGDGVNDAPCLAAAYVSVAMGARGSDAALEQSEVVLMNDRIENFLEAFELSRRARRIIKQNLTLALGTIIVMVSAALFGIVPITVGVIAHEGSTVLVCMNSLRLLFSKRHLP